MKTICILAILAFSLSASAQSTMQDTLHPKDKNKFYGAPATTTLSKKQEKANKKKLKQALRRRKLGLPLTMQQELLLERNRRVVQPK